MSIRKRLDPDKVASFLAESKSQEEVAEKFKLEKKQSECIRGLPVPEGYVIFELMDDCGHKFYRAVLQEKPQIVSRRNWAYWRPNLVEPYIIAQFPEKPALKRMKVVPISDVHYGAKSHFKSKFIEHLRWIEATDEVVAFLNGDMVENAVEGSIGSAIYDSFLTPDEQIYGSVSKGEPGMIELLRPIAHKILWAQPGNHEARSRKCDIDPLKVICAMLDIPFFKEPVYADILAWGQRFTFYCHHGKSGSGTPGGKLNAAAKPAEFQEPMHFIIMGHVHDSMANPVKRFVRKREYDAKGHVTERKIEGRNQYTVICPSFYQYFGSYGSRFAYEPGSEGMVTCLLYPDGMHRVSD